MGGVTVGLIVLGVILLLAVAAVVSGVRDWRHPQRLRRDAERRGAM